MRRTIADQLRAEDKAEGESIATLTTSRAMLIRLLTRRFGPLPDAVRATIEGTEDVDRLNHWFDRVLSVATLDDVGIE